MTEQQREDRIKELQLILKRNPNCKWARNELKYIDMKPLPLPICADGGAMRAEIEYNGR